MAGDVLMETEDEFSEKEDNEDDETNEIKLKMEMCRIYY